MNKRIQIISIDAKKEAQILEDMRMTPEQRFRRMFDLIELSIRLSNGRPLKVYDPNDGAIVLKRREGYRK